MLLSAFSSVSEALSPRAESVRASLISWALSQRAESVQASSMAAAKKSLNDSSSSSSVAPSPLTDSVTSVQTNSNLLAPVAEMLVISSLAYTAASSSSKA